MKKNKMMRLASVLLVLTLLSTSVISGTFAKYTTQDSASDSARVAKWGVELQVVGNLYGESYKDTIETTDNTTITVKTSDSMEVVAPGTKNEEGFSFSLNGQPEVDGKIVTKIEYRNIFLADGQYGVMVKVPAGVVTEDNFSEFTGLYTFADDKFTAATAYNGTEYYTLEDNVSLGEDYYPVEYALFGTDTNYNTSYDVAPLTENSLETIVTKIVANLGAETKRTTANCLTTLEYEHTFETNENLDSYVKLGDQKITWKWDYCQQITCPDGDNACGFCHADTILGMLENTSDNAKVVKLDNNSNYVALVEYTDYCLEADFSIDITVTQED